MKSVDFQLIREKRNVSQQQVANKMGLSLTAYRNKEKGRSRFFFDEIPLFMSAIGIEEREEIVSFMQTYFFD